MMAEEKGLFHGLKVLDCASFIAGPAAATILSDFGADVLKLEPPGTGDPYRHFYKMPPNPPLDANYAWQLTNRNKRSFALDLKSERAGEVLERLIKWADVMVVNFPPKVRKGLKLSYEDVSPLNDQLIYADVTGYGTLGPEANKPGFDITAYWARSGLMQFTRDAASPPAVPVPGIGDHATAMTLYAAIVTGLYRRLRTGKGCLASTSLIAEGAWATAAWLQAALAGATFSGEIDRRNPPNALAGASYQTADKRWLLLAFLGEEKSWPVFARAIGREDLIGDERFASGKARQMHATALVTELDSQFATQPLEYWKKTLDAVRLAYGVVQVPAEIVKDPQLWENEIIVPIENGGPIQYTVDSPLRILEEKKTKPGLAPGLGQHTYEILGELGFDDQAIASLQTDGVIEQAIH